MSNWDQTISEKQTFLATFFFKFDKPLFKVVNIRIFQCEENMNISKKGKKFISKKSKDYFNGLEFHFKGGGRDYFKISH